MFDDCHTSIVDVTILPGSLSVRFLLSSAEGAACAQLASKAAEASGRDRQMLIFDTLACTTHSRSCPSILCTYKLCLGEMSWSYVTGDGVDEVYSRWMTCV